VLYVIYIFFEPCRGTPRVILEEKESLTKKCWLQTKDKGENKNMTPNRNEKEEGNKQRPSTLLTRKKGTYDHRD
jgi:hypothetical protein